MRLILVVWSLVFSVSLFASVESEVDASRFEYRNGTLIDYFSGMQWQDNKDAKTIKKNWQAAKDYCGNLTLDGKSDWRLPHVEELKYFYYSKIWSNLDYISFRYYMSSSESASDSFKVGVVNLRYGYISWDNKSNKFNIRCVRGQQYDNLNSLKREILNNKYAYLYNRAKDINTIVSYEEFIKIYPKAPQAKEAFNNIYRLTKEKNNIIDYEWFISKYPKAPQVKDAIVNIYNLLKKQNNIAGYEWFISKYPKAPQVKDAIVNIHKLAFNKAKDIGTISAYNTFIISYPMAKEANQANKLAKELERYKYTDTLPEWVRNIMPNFLADILNSIFGIFSSDEKKSRALLIKAKQIERQGNEYYGDKKAGYMIVANRMYDLLQEEYDDTDATLRFLESEEFKDFVRTFKSAMSRINDRLDNIAHYSSEILEVSKEGFSQSHADSQMAAYHQEEKTKWDKLMHFMDKGYQ